MKNKLDSQYIQTSIDDYFKCAGRRKTPHRKRLSDKKIERTTKKAMNVSLKEIDSAKDMVSRKPIVIPFKLPRYETDSEDEAEVKKENLENDMSHREKKSDVTITDYIVLSSDDEFIPSKNDSKSTTNVHSTVEKTPSKEFDKSSVHERMKKNPMDVSPMTIKKPTIMRVNNPKNNNTVTNLNDTVLTNNSEYISTSFLNSEELCEPPKKLKILNVTTLNTKDDKIHSEQSSSTSRETSGGNGANLEIELNTTLKDGMRIKKEDEWSPWALNIVLKIIKYITTHKFLIRMLTGRETILVNEFLKLPKSEYQYFCIKLYTRIKKWYSVMDLRTRLNLNMQDSEVMIMYNCLHANGFVDVDYSMEKISDLLNLLSTSDIKGLCKKFKIILLQNPTKPVMIERLLSSSNTQSTLSSRTIEQIILKAIQDKLGCCVRLNQDFYNVLKKIHLLYTFTTNDFETTNDLYLFLSKVQDESIIIPKVVIKDFEVFSTISDFSSFQEAHEFRNNIFIEVGKKNTLGIYGLCNSAYERVLDINEKKIIDMRPLCLQKFTPGYQYTRVLTTGLQHLTKHYPMKVNKWLQYLIEVSLHCRNLIGKWYNMLIMVQYTHLNQTDTAVATLMTALQDKTVSDIDMYELNSRAEKMKNCKKHKLSQRTVCLISELQPVLNQKFPSIEINSQAIGSSVSGKKRNYFKKTEQGLQISKVEDVALNYYYNIGFDNGIHCEGNLLVTIFFVVFWDILYSNKVPYAFINEIQYYPLDLMTEFYDNRKEEISKRLSEIESNWSLSELSTFVDNIWSKHSKERSFINSEIVKEGNDLYNIILCIGRIRLRKILERLAINFHRYKAGLPDLFLWNVTEKMCKFVEVKGENDKLSPKQKCWLNFLSSINANIEVCYVHKIGSKGKRLKMK
ncbi:hypothetical protein FQA39_LY13625 [Lamprigera yunnana]|nr:hypothetical protein FQA39_LY13625 [Lamprigera yunnana]